MTNEQKWIDKIATKFNLKKYHSKQVEWQIGSSRALSTATDAAGVDVVFNEDVPVIFSNMKIQIKRAVVKKNTKGIKVDPSGLYNIKQSGFRVLLMTVYLKNGKRNEFFENIAIIRLNAYNHIRYSGGPYVQSKSNNLKPEIGLLKDNDVIRCDLTHNKEYQDSLVAMKASYFLDLIFNAQSRAVPGESGSKSKLPQTVPSVKNGTKGGKKL